MCDLKGTIISSSSRFLSEDDLHLLEIPEPPTIREESTPTIVRKDDNRSSVGSGSANTNDEKASTMKTASNKSQPQYQHSQSSIICENHNVSNRHVTLESTEEKSCINNLKNIIHKLNIVIINSVIKKVIMCSYVLIFSSFFHLCRS